MRRSSFAPSRLLRISYTTFGSIHAVSTNGTCMNARKQSTRCFVGIRMQQSAMYTSQTFQHPRQQIHPNTRTIGVHGRCRSEQANGLLEVGPFKNSFKPPFKVMNTFALPRTMPASRPAGNQRPRLGNAETRQSPLRTRCLPLYESLTYWDVIVRTLHMSLTSSKQLIMEWRFPPFF